MVLMTIKHHDLINIIYIIGMACWGTWEERLAWNYIDICIPIHRSAENIKIPGLFTTKFLIIFYGASKLMGGGEDLGMCVHKYNGWWWCT